LNNIDFTQLIKSFYKSKDAALGAKEVLAVMDAIKLKADVITYSCILEACSQSLALSFGQLIHSRIVKEQLVKDLHVSLMSFYIACNRLDLAANVVLEVQQHYSAPTVQTWTVLITAFSRGGDTQQAIRLFETMVKSRVTPNEVSFLSFLASCQTLALGRRLNEWIDIFKVPRSIRLQTAVISMFGNCKSLDDAVAVFDQTRSLSQLDTPFWNAIMQAVILKFI
jgi:pentatricopeptide repeat protein